MDTLWAMMLWENDIIDSLEAITIPNLMISVTEPGLSSKIGLLSENWVSLENWLSAEYSIDHFEVISNRDTIIPNSQINNG